MRARIISTTDWDFPSWSWMLMLFFGNFFTIWLSSCWLQKVLLDPGMIVKEAFGTKQKEGLAETKIVHKMFCRSQS